MGEVAQSSSSELKEAAQTETWRYGRYPIPPAEQLCPGEPEWEPGTSWWMCPRCGHVGRAPYFGHYAAREPVPRRTEKKGWGRVAMAVAPLIAALASLLTLARRG